MRGPFKTQFAATPTIFRSRQSGTRRSGGRRSALASALYRTFSQQTAEMTALRAGLFRYWGRTRTGPSVSIALLSTRESRMWIMAREYARAVGFGLSVLRSSSWNVGTAIQLAGTVLPHLGKLLSGALEDLRSASGRVLMRLRARRAHRPAVAEPEPSRAPLSRL